MKEPLGWTEERENGGVLASSVATQPLPLLISINFPREPSSWQLGRKSASIQVTIRTVHQEVLDQIADNRKRPFL